MAHDTSCTSFFYERTQHVHVINVYASPPPARKRAARSRSFHRQDPRPLPAQSRAPFIASSSAPFAPSPLPRANSTTGGTSPRLASPQRLLPAAENRSAPCRAARSHAPEASPPARAPHARSRTPSEALPPLRSRAASSSSTGSLEKSRNVGLPASRAGTRVSTPPAPNQGWATPSAARACDAVVRNVRARSSRPAPLTARLRRARRTFSEAGACATGGC